MHCEANQDFIFVNFKPNVRSYYEQSLVQEIPIGKLIRLVQLGVFLINMWVKPASSDELTQSVFLNMTRANNLYQPFIYIAFANRDQPALSEFNKSHSS